jgi:hypothetical protein
MTEQQRIKRQRPKPRRRVVTTPIQNESALGEETKQAINRLDEAFDDVIARRTTATSVVAGEQERHSLREMSDEELVKKFRQEGGE